MTLRLGVLGFLLVIYVLAGFVVPVLKIGKDTSSYTPGGALVSMALTSLQIVALLYLSGYIGAGR